MDVLRRVYFQEKRFMSQTVSLCLVSLSLVTSSVTSMIVSYRDKHWKRTMPKREASLKRQHQTTRASKAQMFSSLSSAFSRETCLSLNREDILCWRFMLSSCFFLHPSLTSCQRCAWMQVKQVSHSHKLKKKYIRTWLTVYCNCKWSEWKCPQDVKSSKVFIVRER